MTITFVAAVESVHLDQDLIQRLLALVVAAAKTGAALATDRVDFVDEDDARRVALGLIEEVAYTRLAPTPTNISTNSEPEMLKNGTPASPATARESSVLPVPGGPTSSTPRGMRAPSAGELFRVLQELDDFDQLLLRPHPPQRHHAKVTVGLLAVNRRARLLPNDIA